MLYFNTSDIFTVPEHFNPNLFYPKALKRSICAFSLYFTSNQVDPFVSFNVLEYGGGLTALPEDILLEYNEQSTQNWWYQYLGIDIGLDLNCNFYQVQIVVQETAITTRTYYSNWFFVFGTSIANRLEFGGSGDFGTKLLSTGFYFKLYFDKRAIIQEPFYEETIIETDNVTQEREYQLFSEQFTLTIYCEKWLLKELQELPFYDDCLLYFEEYNGEEILDIIEVSSSYNEEIRLHEVILTFKVNQLDKSCIIETDVQDIPIGGGNAVDGAGNNLIVSASDNLIFSN